MKSHPMPFSSKKQQPYLGRSGAWIPVDWVFGAKGDSLIPDHTSAINRALSEAACEAFPPSEKEIVEKYGEDYL